MESYLPLALITIFTGFANNTQDIILHNVNCGEKNILASLYNELKIKTATQI